MRGHVIRQLRLWSGAVPFAGPRALAQRPENKPSSDAVFLPNDSGDSPPPA